MTHPLYLAPWSLRMGVSEFLSQFIYRFPYNLNQFDYTKILQRALFYIFRVRGRTFDKSFYSFVDMYKPLFISNSLSHK